MTSKTLKGKATNTFRAGLCDVTHHIRQGNVEEHSSCDGEDCIRCKAAPEQDAKHETNVTRQGWQQVEENGLWDAHTSVQQDHKVTCSNAQG